MSGQSHCVGILHTPAFGEQPSLYLAKEGFNVNSHFVHFLDPDHKLPTTVLVSQITRKKRERARDGISV